MIYACYCDEATYPGKSAWQNQSTDWTLKTVCKTADYLNGLNNTITETKQHVWNILHSGAHVFNKWVLKDI